MKTQIKIFIGPDIEKKVNAWLYNRAGAGIEIKDIKYFGAESPHRRSILILFETNNI